MKLTDHEVRRAVLPAGKDDAVLFDEKLSGFGLRLRRGAGGVIKKTWIVQYRDAGGKSHKALLGTTEELKAGVARDRAADVLADVRKKTYPHVERRKAKELAKEAFGLIAERYLAVCEARLRPRSFVEVKRHIEKRWSNFSSDSIHAIDQRRIAERLGKIAKVNGAVEADRARATLSALFNWAAGEGIVTDNPVSRTNKPAENKARDRWLTDAELAEVWGACRDDDYGRIVKVLLLTGQRREEVGAMAWDEIDLEAGTWTLSKERTKNEEAHVVPLATAVVGILGTVSRQTRKAGQPDFLWGRGEAGFGGWSKAKDGLDERIAAARQKAGIEKPMAEWRLHDLRRTVATQMGNVLKIPPHIVETILNHKAGFRGGIAGVYNKARYFDEVKKALEDWAARVMLIVDRPSNVVPIRA